MEEFGVKVLEGKILVSAKNEDDKRIIFDTDTGETFALFHKQDCCENVYVEDICGELADLAGSPIITAEEVSNEDRPPLYDDEENYTWTFYRFATAKGAVTIRFYGTSTGYYSESVSFEAL